MQRVPTYFVLFLQSLIISNSKQYVQKNNHLINNVFPSFYVMYGTDRD